MEKQKRHKRGNRIECELTDAEVRIVEWIRRNSNGRDWYGTIRYVSGVNVYQLFDLRQAGQAAQRN